MIKMINYMFWAEQVGVDPPQGESPKRYSRLDMNPDDISSRKMLKRLAASCGVNPEIRGPQKKEEKKNQVLINKNYRVFQWFSHGVKH